LKGDWLKNQEAYYKKQEEPKKPVPKPKDNDLVFTPDDIEDDSAKPNFNNIKDMD